MCVAGGRGQTETENGTVKAGLVQKVNVSKDWKEEGVSLADTWANRTVSANL